MRNGLAAIVVASSLALGICARSHQTETTEVPKQGGVTPVESKAQYELIRSTISGKIMNIDKDSFAVYHGELSTATADFRYEILSILIKEGEKEELKKILVPQPTELNVGEKIGGVYYPLSSITFQDILKLSSYQNLLSMQTGSLQIDGMMDNSTKYHRSR